MQIEVNYKSASVLVTVLQLQLQLTVSERKIAWINNVIP